MSASLPYAKKLFYKINEVSEIVGVEAYVLRYWETKFPTLKPERLSNDERRYRSKDIDLLLRIRSLLYDEKFTIAGAVDRIKRDPKGSVEVQEVPRVIEIALEPVAIAEEIVEPDLFDSGVHSVPAYALKEKLSRLRESLTSLRDSIPAGSY